MFFWGFGEIVISKRANRVLEYTCRSSSAHAGVQILEVSLFFIDGGFRSDRLFYQVLDVTDRLDSDVISNRGNNTRCRGWRKMAPTTTLTTGNKDGGVENKKNEKKANLLDSHSIKHVLDESASQVFFRSRYVLSFGRDSSIQGFDLFTRCFVDFVMLFGQIVMRKGFVEDVRLSNARLGLGSVIIVIALVAQFYNKKFPGNRDFLLGCILLYPSFDYRFLDFCIICSKSKLEFLVREVAFFSEIILSDYNYVQFSFFPF